MNVQKKKNPTKKTNPDLNSLIPVNGTLLIAPLLRLTQNLAWKTFSTNRLFHVEHCLPKTACILAAYTQPKCGPLQIALHFTSLHIK